MGTKAHSHPLYRIWAAMRQRCLNPKDHAFHHYGGRGIFVCERWKDFWSFISDMGERPDGYWLDRVDNNGPYSPDNCRWASPKQQNRNRRDTIYVEFNGELVPLSDLADMHGVSPAAARGRLRNGYPMEVVLLPKVLPRGDAKKANAASAAVRSAITHCPQGHEYTPENTTIENGGRSCRTCRNDRQRLRARQRRLAAKANGQ